MKSKEDATGQGSTRVSCRTQARQGAACNIHLQQKRPEHKVPQLRPFEQRRDECAKSTTRRPARSGHSNDGGENQLYNQEQEWE